MFHLLLALAYLIPNVYAYFRLSKLFINKGYRKYFTLVFLVVALLYPFVNLISGPNPGFLTRMLITVSGYMLPFYLYLFLSVLLFDCLLLVNRFVKVVPVSVRESLKFKVYGMTGIVLLATGIVVAGAINLNTIRISEYQLEIPRRSSKIDHLKIAFVADFHLKQTVEADYVEQFRQKIETIQPDLMLFGGDIIEGDKDDGNMTDFENILKKIQPKYGSYAILGNHEFYGGPKRGRFFAKAGMKLLLDSTLVVDGSFNLAGRLDSRYRERKSVEELMHSVNDSLPVILMDHRPTELEQISKTTVDISLSGHTHNGQLFPLNLILRTMYRLTWGYEKIDHTHFFVTSGIRLWGPPVRTVGKSEIIVLDVKLR